MHLRHLKLNFCFKSILFLFGLFLYCEYLVYWVVLQNCDWPQLNKKNEDSSIEKTDYEPVKVMVLSDTHLLGSKRGHWFDKLRREWQMYRAFQTAIALHKPELVFVLGDLTDEGLFCSPVEFNYYVHRFYSLFAVPEGTKLYVVVGNHDIGFHYGVSPYLNHRFVSAFNASAVQLISVRGNHFVLVNSMALEGDGCFLCRPAKQQLTKIENILKCTEGKQKCDPKFKLSMYSKPILMQHYPLYRKSDMECDDLDAAPQPIKQELFREGWECLTREATHQLVTQIKPRVSVSGHTHHGCTRPLPFNLGLEITLPSFSWRNKDNPNYGLFVFAPNNYAYFKCQMPKESSVLLIYVFGVLSLLIYLAYSISIQTRRRFQFFLRRKL